MPAAEGSGPAISPSYASVPTGGVAPIRQPWHFPSAFCFFITLGPRRQGFRRFISSQSGHFNEVMHFFIGPVFCVGAMA